MLYIYIYIYILLNLSLYVRYGAKLQKIASNQRNLAGFKSQFENFNTFENISTKCSKMRPKVLKCYKASLNECQNRSFDPSVSTTIFSTWPITGPSYEEFLNGKIWVLRDLSFRMVPRALFGPVDEKHNWHRSCFGTEMAKRHNLNRWWTASANAVCLHGFVLLVLLHGSSSY